MLLWYEMYVHFVPEERLEYWELFPTDCEDIAVMNLNRALIEP
jgi:hypothetical protein